MQENESKSPVEAEDFTISEGEKKLEELSQDSTMIPDVEHTEIENLTTELAEQKDKYLRLFAEFDNYKRRTSKEAIEQRQTAGKDVIISLLDVLDDMDRAEKQLQESDSNENVKEGIMLVFDKFRKTLQAKGLQAIKTLHTEFDVEKDEAVSEIEVDDKKLKGKVVAELQKGYMLNDKLIRFAKVVVGK
ncbi:MAG TPA: nucleotide exchange factor GrpE, partial [Hanamia sp.]|jgi:molecular chaperone GrpE|nr:nucleotide exchange factor GrpE [Hanamia sp.]